MELAVKVGNLFFLRFAVVRLFLSSPTERSLKVGEQLVGVILREVLDVDLVLVFSIAEFSHEAPHVLDCVLSGFFRERINT